MKSLHLLLIMGLLASPGWSQTSKPDSQTQQQILDELRAIHRDLRASTTLQLLLTELQVTQTTLDRALQKRDSLKANLTQMHLDKTSAKEEADKYEAGMQKVVNPGEEFVSRLEELKDALRKITALETATTEQLQDAEARLNTAEAERDRIQGQLGDLVKKLGTFN